MSIRNTTNSLKSINSQSSSSLPSLIKEIMANMPNNLTTKKDIDEYYKNAMKEVKEKIKNERMTARSSKIISKIDDDDDDDVNKRIPTPYNKFVKKMYSELHKKFPNDSAPEIMKKIGVEWRKTNKDDSESKDDDSEEEDEKEAGMSANLRKKNTDTVKIKKPLNSYQQFIKDNRQKLVEENPGLTAQKYFTLLATMWKEHKQDKQANA